MAGPKLQRRLVATSEALSNIPITANLNKSLGARELPVDGLCSPTKPFHVQDFLTYIRSALERRESNGREP